MDNIHNISIIGSTGSIGTQTLEVCDNCPEIRPVSLACGANTALMEEQIRKYTPLLAAVSDEERAKDLRIRVADTPTKIVSGQEGIIEAATIRDAKTVVTGIVGIAGLIPTISAIKAGKNIALANKETLVTGGHIVMKLAKEYKVKILPVDSEHSAIFQSMQGFDKRDIKRIILTASGGAFLGKTKKELENITPADALKHPNWDMGAKVTVDSSTLVNKGLEVIEASHLFDVDVSKIKVLIHPQSVVHSMVEYMDNGVIAQLGVPDMKLPIQYALTYPKRVKMYENELDFEKYSSLTFGEPDTDTFFALDVAYEAAKKGGIVPTVFNGADEAAVSLFLKGHIKYTDISQLIKEAVNSAKNIDNPDIHDIFAADRYAKEYVLNISK